MIYSKHNIDFGYMKHYNWNVTAELRDSDHMYMISHRIASVITDTLEDAIVNGITKIAEEKGVTDLIVLNRTTIAEALLKATPRKVKREFYVECPNCSEHVMSYTFKYCPECGQRLDWSEV